MFRKTLLTAIVMASLSFNAQAGIYNFDFNASNNSYEVSGTFGTADVLNSVGGYDILSITGSVIGAGGGLIDSLVINPLQPIHTTCCIANGYFIIYDNNLFPTSNAYLDWFGVTFTAGGNTWNLFGNNPTSSDYGLFSSTEVNGAPLVNSIQGAMVVAPVPEPATYAMLLAGLGLIGFMSSRRKQNFNV
jgi:hypothetical protein